MSLDENLVLQHLDNLEVRLDAAEGPTIIAGERVIHCGTHGLAVLDAFSTPVSVQEAMARLKGRAAGVQDWLDLLGTVASLHAEGVLVEPSALGVARRAGRIDLDISSYHALMLDDRDRTSAFQKAIEQTVRPGDVVLDLGTGTGVLALTAARAGARKVYAIEAGDIADAAEALFEANGYGDTIELVRGWSTKVSLPERADVLVSEIIGTQPLGERVLELTRDAFHRHLVPGARTVPSRLRIYGLAVPRPKREVDEMLFTAETVSRWSEWYGLDFSPLAEAVPDEVVFVHMHDKEVRELGRLAPPVFFGEVVLDAARDLVFESTVEATVERAGEVAGVAVYFELDLVEGIQLTNDPGRSGGTNHWANPVGLLPAALRVEPGDTLEITYRYGGSAHELTCEKR